MIERIQLETLRFSCPLVAGELVRREPLAYFQPQIEVVSTYGVGDMLFELQVAVVVKESDGDFFDYAVHHANQAVSIRVFDLG